MVLLPFVTEHGGVVLPPLLRIDIWLLDDVDAKT